MYQLPCSVAVTLCDWPCWFVTDTDRVPFEFFVIDVVDNEQEYCVEVSHWFEHAANEMFILAAIKNAAIIKINKCFFIFFIPP